MRFEFTEYNNDETTNNTNTYTLSLWNAKVINDNKRNNITNLNFLNDIWKNSKIKINIKIIVIPLGVAFQLVYLTKIGVNNSMWVDSKHKLLECKKILDNKKITWVERIETNIFTISNVRYMSIPDNAEKADNKTK